MVTEFGMSDRIGPRAWGGSGPVFLGDDFGQQREYSEQTAQLIDDEVERILRAGEERCRKLLTEHRAALDLIARALLEHETISGVEVNRLIAAAGGTLPGQSTQPAAPADEAPAQTAQTAQTAQPPAPAAAGNGDGAPTPPPVPPHLASGGTPEQPSAPTQTPR